MTNRTLRAGGLLLAALGLLLPASGDAARPCEIRNIVTGGSAVALDRQAANACALRADGGVLCWGGDGFRIPLSKRPDGVFSRVAMGSHHACGVRVDGAVDCWPIDHWDLTPPAFDGTFADVSVGDELTCGLRTDGRVTCRSNSDGSEEIPVPEGTFLDVVCGGGHACGRRTDRSVECWGEEFYGEASPPPGAFSQVVAGKRSTCGIGEDAGLRCWGYNVGNGELAPPPGRFVQLSMHHTDQFFGDTDPGACAVREDGEWICWGSLAGLATPDGVFREVAVGGMPCGVRSDGSLECLVEPDQTRTKPLVGSFVQVSAGGSAPIIVSLTCALDRDGSIKCAGNNDYGQASPPPGSFRQVASGAYHGCGLREDGGVSCWGDNMLKQCDAPSGAFVQISAGLMHTCGLRDDGRLACWGLQKESLKVPGGTYTRVAAGGMHACALDPQGEARCWDYRSGAPSYDVPEGPFVDLTASGAYAYSESGSLTCGLRTNGSIACWGDDVFGLLDPPAGEFVQVSAGAEHACALTKDGHVACWGGDPGYHERLPAEGGFVAVSAGYYHSCGLKDGGVVECWGLDQVASYCGPSSRCGDGVVDDDEGCDGGNVPYEGGLACTDACSRVPCGQPTHPVAAVPGASDALFALEAAVELRSCDLRVCDLNGSLDLTVADAFLILRSAVGVDVERKCPD